MTRGVGVEGIWSVFVHKAHVLLSSGMRLQSSARQYLLYMGQSDRQQRAPCRVRVEAGVVWRVGVLGPNGEDMSVHQRRIGPFILHQCTQCGNNEAVSFAFNM